MLTCAATGCEETPARVTTTLAEPGINCQGACALIWRSETNRRRAGVPLMVTESTSASDVERGTEPAMARVEAKPVPKMEIRDPGAIVVLWPRPAAFTTPPCSIIDVWAKAA